jgi:bacteriorhodopsin
MFQHFSGRAAVLIHGSLGLLFFAYMLTGPVGTYFDLAAERRLQVSTEDRDQIMQEQMKSASRISLIFSSAFFFMLSCWLMTHLTEMNFSLVQRSTMAKRLDFCLTLCLYITFFSALFNAVQLMDDDNLMVYAIDGSETILDLGRIVEWMLTCPLIQLAVPMIAGEKVPDYRRYAMPITAFITLSCGLLSTLASNIVMKALAYSAGCVFFMLMLYFMNACVSESTGESLFYGTSFLRGLAVLIALTWAPFPIWYALSPEGFNIIKDQPGMKVAVAFLNLFSKGSFIMYLTRIRADFQTRQKTMISLGYIHSDGTVNKKGSVDVDLDGTAKDGKNDEETMDKTTVVMLEEVLETMGRSKDKTSVLNLLQAQLITSNDDVLSLTKEYCREINLPWGLVLALKSKIRSHTIQVDDPWSMNGIGKSKEPELSYAAPHIAKNNKKIASVQRRHNTFDDAMSAGFSEPLSPPSHPGPGFNDHAAPTHSDDAAAMAAVLESHQKNVNTQVDECRQFVMHSMDKIMNVLEHRLDDANRHPQAAHPIHSQAQAAHPSHPQAVIPTYLQAAPQSTEKHFPH